MKQKKRKALLSGVTAVLCVLIMVTGTFAWTSFSQTAINEVRGKLGNPGGRLHDDFNGRNKDIYVENFTSVTSGKPILVRVRLKEYMEIGADAGVTTDSDGDPLDAQGLEARDVTKLSGKDAKLTDTDTWDTYVYGSGTSSETHYGYWKWTLGGKTVYMPTFNTDKDSDASDRNGTLENASGLYPDYRAYTIGEAKTQDGETHYAKETIDGSVMTMLQWSALGSEEERLGDFWVYDSDGWAYWASPLWQDSATGLLLDEIRPQKSIADDWYYGIHVECQMTDFEDVGQFFEEDVSGSVPSDTAKMLLQAILESAEGEEALIMPVSEGDELTETEETITDGNENAGDLITGSEDEAASDVSSDQVSENETKPEDEAPDAEKEPDSEPPSEEDTGADETADSEVADDSGKTDADDAPDQEIPDETPPEAIDPSEETPLPEEDPLETQTAETT